MDKRLYTLIFKSFLAILIFAALKFFFYHTGNNPDANLDGLKKEKKIDWLIIGASHVESSYDIQKLKSETGLNFYKITFANIDPLEIKILLDEIINRSNPKICHIIVDVSTSLLDSPIKVPSTNSVIYNEAPISVKLELLKTYYHYYPTPLQRLYVLLLSSGASDFLVQILNLNQRPQQKPLDIDTKEMTQKRWDDFVKNYGRARTENKINEVYKKGLMETASLLSATYPGRAWFSETPLPEFTSRSPQYKSLKRQLSSILSQYPSIGFIETEKFGFPVKDRLLFTDHHHLSLHGKELNTPLFIKNFIVPQTREPKPFSASDTDCQ